MIMHATKQTSVNPHPVKGRSEAKTWRARMTLMASALLMAVGLLLIPAPAQAASSSGIIGGSGTLSCSGSGRALLLMHGKLEWAATGAANLGLHAAAIIHADGEGTRVDVGRWTRFENWNGTVTVRDARYQAHMQGDDITFTATGKGRAILKGEGECMVNGEPLTLGEIGQVVELE